MLNELQDAYEEGVFVITSLFFPPFALILIPLHVIGFCIWINYEIKKQRKLLSSL